MLGGKGYFLRWWSPTLFETWIAANEKSSGFQQVAHWISISKPYLATNPRVFKALNSCFPTLFNLSSKVRVQASGQFFILNALRWLLQDDHKHALLRIELSKWLDRLKHWCVGFCLTGQQLAQWQLGRKPRIKGDKKNWTYHLLEKVLNLHKPTE